MRELPLRTELRAAPAPRWPMLLGIVMLVVAALLLWAGGRGAP
jgi:hypothetical protein